MDRQQLAEILKRLGYADITIKMFLSCKQKPNYEVMLKLSKEHGIPFEAWQDIRAWLGLPPTRTQLKARKQNAPSPKIKGKK